MNLEKTYFPNLNGLRFIAALLVVIHHIEQLKSIHGMDNYWLSSPFIGVIGRLGVTLFFVLSGFLITSLLLAEEAVNNTINIKNFYVRRILRIWPLYFILLVLALFVLPHFSLFDLPGYGKNMIYENLVTKIVLMVLFLPNLALSVFPPIPYLSHNWSIGTEQQFYLLWPALLNYVKNNRILLMIAIVGCHFLIRFFLASKASYFLPYRASITAFWSLFSIQTMAIGGFFAIAYHQKSKILDWFRNRMVFIISLIIAVFCIINGVFIPYFHQEVYALLFGIIILNFATFPHRFIHLNQPILNYLGSISYGIYMYHLMAIALALVCCNAFGLKSNIFLYVISLLLTIIISALSYEYFESYFLKMKRKFEPHSSSKHLASESLTV